MLLGNEDYMYRNDRDNLELTFAEQRTDRPAPSLGAVTNPVHPYTSAHNDAAAMLPHTRFVHNMRCIS